MMRGMLATHPENNIRMSNTILASCPRLPMLVRNFHSPITYLDVGTTPLSECVVKKTNQNNVVSPELLNWSEVWLMATTTLS